MILVEAENKAILYRSGDQDCSVYFTLLGVAQEFVETTQSAAKMNISGPGDILGEIDFMDEKARTVSALVREPFQFLKISLDQKATLKQNYRILWENLHYDLIKRAVNRLKTTQSSQYALFEGEYKMSGLKKKAVMFCSEPLTQDVTTWVEVPEYSIMTAQREKGEIIIQTEDLDI